MRRRAACILWAVAVLGLWAGARAQIDALPESASLLDAAIEGNAILRPGNATGTEEPIRGSVEPGELDIFAVVVAKKRAWPDVVVTLELVDHTGTVDVFCLPEDHLLSGDALVSGALDRAAWRTESSQGINALFISRHDPSYGVAKTNRTGDGSQLDTAIFACAVGAASTMKTSFEVRVDVDYHRRSLISEEQNVIMNIFDRCCGDASQCMKWGKDVTSRKAIKEFCYLDGIMCDGNGRLTHLDISQNQLVCDVPAGDLQMLGSLEVLQMSSNSLTGDVSKIIAKLLSISSIRHLDFSNNFISGSVSDTGDKGLPPACKLVDTQLVWLNLDANRIEGEVPGCLFAEKSKLRGLKMGNNALRGPVPDIPSASVVQELGLSHGNLSGTIPTSMGMVRHLQSLDLGYNALTGTVPASLATLTGLYNLQLSNNNLEGGLPEALGTSPVLRFLDVSSNSLSSLPSQWMSNGLNASGFVLLDISRNQFSGSFPMAITKAPNLIMFNVQENNFTGQLPAEEGMMKRMAVLFLGDNHFKGTIPEEFGSIGMFTEADAGLPIVPRLDLSNNLLTGRLPEFLFAENVPDELQRHISLGGNSFQCPIPREVAYLQGLTCKAIQTSEEPELTAEIEGQDGGKHKGVAIVVVAGVGGFLLVGLVAVGVFVIMWRRTKWRESADTTGDASSEGDPYRRDGEPDFNAYYHT